KLPPAEITTVPPSASPPALPAVAEMLISCAAVPMVRLLFGAVALRLTEPPPAWGGNGPVLTELGDSDNPRGVLEFMTLPPATRMEPEVFDPLAAMAPPGMVSGPLPALIVMVPAVPSVGCDADTVEEADIAAGELNVIPPPPVLAIVIVPAFI